MDIIDRLDYGECLNNQTFVVQILFQERVVSPDHNPDGFKTIGIASDLTYLSERQSVKIGRLVMQPKKFEEIEKDFHSGDTFFNSRVVYDVDPATKYRLLVVGEGRMRGIISDFCPYKFSNGRYCSFEGFFSIAEMGGDVDFSYRLFDADFPVSASPEASGIDNDFSYLLKQEAHLAKILNIQKHTSDKVEDRFSEILDILEEKK